MIWTKQSDVKARRNGHWMPDQLNPEYTYTNVVHVHVVVCLC